MGNLPLTEFCLATYSATTAPPPPFELTRSVVPAVTGSAGSTGKLAGFVGETDGAGFRALGAHAMPDGLVSIFRHEAFEFGFGLLVFEVRRPAKAKALTAGHRSPTLYYLSYKCSRPMKTVSAREANHEFSDLLSRAERGEEFLITKRSKPVAVLSPYRPPVMTAERKRAIQHAVKVMAKGLRWGRSLQTFKREEMHER